MSAGCGHLNEAPASGAARSLQGDAASMQLGLLRHSCRLVNRWFDDAAAVAAAGGGKDCLAVAVTTAELAEAASHGEALQPHAGQLLRFVDGCRQRLRAEDASEPTALPAAAQPAAAANAGASSAGDKAAIAVAPAAALQTAAAAAAAPPVAAAVSSAPPAAAAATVAREPQAWICTTQGGWDAALGLAAVALARLTTGRSRDSGFGGGGGGGSSGGGGGSSSSGSSSGNDEGGGSDCSMPSEAQRAAFAASLAAAQALLASHSLGLSNSAKQSTAVAEAVAAPLWYSNAFLHPKQRHLQRVGEVLQSAVAEFAAAVTRGAFETPAAAPAAGGHGGSRSKPAAAARDSGAIAASLAAGTAAGDGDARRVLRVRRQMDPLSLASRMQRVTQALPHIVSVLSDIDVDGLAAWPAWQPWSEAVASCFQLLAPADLAALDAEATLTWRLVRSATTDLLTTAQHILAVATTRGVAALQQPPAPALLDAVIDIAAARDPWGGDAAAERRRTVGAYMAAYMVLEAVGGAIAASSPTSPPLSPQLLRSCCAALTAHLGKAAAKSRTGNTAGSTA